jgi:SAM-dependent methyltransferase
MSDKPEAIERRKSIVIGIPCYQNAPSETLTDYMRFAYYLGRRYQEYDFFLAVKAKTEQFRARNAIVEVALKVGADYLLMLDDDQVIDWQDSNAPTNQYEFLRTLIRHLEQDPTKGIVGALYYHRGGSCRPVVMREGEDGGYYYLRDDEIRGELQEVAVAGGGCILLNMKIFDRIPSPWFEAELDFGTDVQICSKARKEGFTVWVDTSLVLGHVLSRREVITPKNRHLFMAENTERLSEGMDSAWKNSAALRLYRMDAEEYVGSPMAEWAGLYATYALKQSKFGEHADKRDYYRNMGVEQLIRQVGFHHNDWVIRQMEAILACVNTQGLGHGADFGCGSAPVGFELVMRGNSVDFIDLDGAGGYEFTKWRAKHRGVENRCGWSWGGPYDFILALDSIEHLEDWRGPLQEMVDRLRPDGFLITNFFLNEDKANPEHINMDKEGVKSFLVSNGVYPVNQMLWVKRNLKAA